MLLLLCAISLLLGSIQAFTREEANEYIDRVLSGRFTEEAEYSRLEPYRLENITTSINSSRGTTGRAVLYGGQLFHLSEVKRLGECRVPFYQSANTTFTCFLKFDQLKIKYRASADYENMNVKFYPTVSIQDTNATVQVTSNRQEDIPNLNLLFLNRVGSMKVTAEMISIGDLKDIVGPPVRAALESEAVRAVYRAVGGRFKDALAYSIYKTPLGLTF